MRRRSHQRGAAVVFGSLAASVALNVLVGLPVLALLGAYLQGTVDHASDRPVKVVKLSAEQWSKNQRTAEAAKRKTSPSPERAQPAPDAAKDDAATVAKKVEPVKPPEPEERPRGLVVDVPPTRDDSPNRDAKYLSKYNTHVEKETTARVSDVDLHEKRTSNVRSHLEAPSVKEAIPTKNLSMKGNGGTLERSDSTEKSGDHEARRRFILEMPDLMRRDAVHLQPGAGAGLGEHLANRTGSEAMRGNSTQLRVQEGTGTGDEDSDKGAAKKGTAEGSDEKKPLPSLAAVVPVLGVQGRMAGAPHDHVDGLPEGDGTFLNTREFKHATFFHRVKESVASRWEDDLHAEIRRRDPTGNVYGVRDRSTVLLIQLDLAGTVSDVRVEQTSGVDFLDSVAVQAFRKTEHFPNPPKALADPDGAIRFTFEFKVLGPGSSSNPFDFR